MKFLNNINSELLDILNPYMDWFFSQEDINNLPVEENRINGHTIDSCCTESYLKEVMRPEHKGIPEVACVSNLELNMKIPKHHREKSKEICDQLVRFLGAKFNAVHVFYPKGGFMGWHNNWDCPGYNILINYNPEGDGWFKYWDAPNENIVTMYDPEGWSAKVGYYGGKNESEEHHFWHCAGSHSHRQTFGFVIPDKNMWEMMCEDISS